MASKHKQKEIIEDPNVGYSPEPDLVSSCASSITRDKTGYGVEEAGETAASESEYESC